MLLVKPLPIGQPLPRAIDARVLCGETVTVRVGRGGLSLFALSYAPSASAITVSASILAAFRELAMPEPIRGTVIKAASPMAA